MVDLDLAAVITVMGIVYAAAGWLVSARAQRRWRRRRPVLGALVFVGWPAFVLGVEVLWLLGFNEWDLRS